MSLTRKDLQLIKQIIDTAFQDPNNPLKRELKNDIIKFKDEILAEIRKLRDDVSVVVGYREMIDSLENDVKKLKKIHPKYQHISV